MLNSYRFEAQLTAVKERLEAAKVGSTRGLGGMAAPGGASFFGQGSRIAKPLRGGGGAGDFPPVPTVANLQQESQPSKRSSWFFQQRT